MNFVTMTILGFGAVAVVACGGKAEQAAPKKAVYLKGEAAAKWDGLCVSCHGKKGAGDGVASASLAVKPRSFSDATWQASVTDEHLAKVIVGGGTAVGMSELMPASPELADKPEIVAQIIAKIRSL